MNCLQIGWKALVRQLRLTMGWKALEEKVINSRFAIFRSITINCVFTHRSYPLSFSRPLFFSAHGWLLGLGTGLGYCTLVVITMITIYYMVIIAWIIFYFVASFEPDLGWGSCLNDFNTDGKYLIQCRSLGRGCDLWSTMTKKHVRLNAVVCRPTTNKLESKAVCAYYIYVCIPIEKRVSNDVREAADDHTNINTHFHHKSWVRAIRLFGGRRCLSSKALSDRVN